MPKPSTLLNQWLSESTEITSDDRNNILDLSEIFYHIAETKKVDFKNTTWNPDFFVEYGAWFDNWLAWVKDKPVATEIQIQEVL